MIKKNKNGKKIMAKSMPKNSSNEINMTYFLFTLPT